jgi:hypothetical protein
MTNLEEDDADERMSFLNNKNENNKEQLMSEKANRNTNSSSPKKRWILVVAGLVAFGFVFLYSAENTSKSDVADIEEKPEPSAHDPPDIGNIGKINSHGTSTSALTSAPAVTTATTMSETRAPVITSSVVKTSAPVVTVKTNAPVISDFGTVDTQTKTAYADGITKPLTNAELPPGFKKPEAVLSASYIPRGKPIDETERKRLAETWGEWNFVDDRAATRPTTIPYEDYPNRDIPRAAFPASSWQTDQTYLAKWLPEAIAHTERAMEAMLAEYGNSKIDMPDKNFAERAYMFNVTLKSRNNFIYNKKNPPGNAGYASPESLAGIKRRLLHAVMTEDSFIFVMGGHSAAAGHGNNFQQSYTLQVQRILEPVLARLGVYHKSHNFGMGGLGTLQNCIAAQDLYGPDIDVIMWDSSMTEGDAFSKDVFARKALLTGNRVPVLWGEPDGARYDQKAPGAGSLHTGFWGK